MEEKKKSDFKNKSNTTENSRIELPNFRPGSANSNSRPGPSNPNPGPATSINNWQERDRDRKLPKKRSHSENDDWGRDNKLNKSETLERVKNEGNCVNENCSDNPFSLQEIAMASRQLAIASMSQQPMAVTLPQQPQQQIMHSPAMPYQPYSYNATENYHIDPNHGTFGPIPFSSMMPLNTQWPVNHALPAATSSIASTSGIGMCNGMEMVSPTNGNINGFSYVSNSDGSYSVVPSMPIYAPYPVLNSQEPIIPIFNNLEPIIINHAVLTPPLPGETRRRREKPPGCRTVYVGNLPEKVTEEMIRDAFKLCGPISVIRMSKKNFCHIRFANMESVEQALLLSGFKIRIDDNEDSACNSKLHVDYALARDDQHDYECLERARLREERHRQQEVYRPPSPPPIPHFSDNEYSALAERLRKEETFKEALQVLITWLDRGECNKKNSGNFFSLIQSSHNHIKRLRNEKSKFKEEADKANENLMNKNRAVESEVNEIEKVFVAAKTQKVWDHFTRSQRKKMEEMKNDTQDLKQTNSKELVIKREEEEMEMSDTEDKNENEDGNIPEGIAEELNTLREKTNSLKEELDSANQTIEDITLKNVELNDENLRLRLELEEGRRLERSDNVATISAEDQLSINDSATQYSPIRVDATENEQQLISLVSIFLQVHPFGASIDYICSYLVKMVPAVNARDVESLLRRFPCLFKEVSTGIGATLEKKWIYVGFNSMLN